MQVKKRILMAIGVLAAANLLLLGAGAIPAVLSINQYAARIAEEHEKLDTQYALRLFMRDSASKLSSAVSRLKALSAFAVPQGGELAFITALERAAETSGVSQRIALETVNQKDLSPWEREIPLRLDFSGTYPQVLRHLNAIERLPYGIVVTGIDVAAPRSLGDRNPQGLTDVTVSATVYWQSEDAPDFVRGVNGVAVPE